MANESMISLNVNLGSTKNVTAEFDALVKVLESKKIKLDVDTTSLQASLKLASSEIEKSYSKIKNTVKKANDEISKPAKGNNSGISDLEKQITSAEKAIGKFTETKNKQLNNILAGNNGTMVPNLTEYDTLVTKMNELKNMKLDSTNVDTYTQNVKEVQTAYDELTTKIRQVSSTSKEMNSSVKMNSDITNKVRDYNTQLEVMRQKNADIINNPIYQQIANDVNKLSQANQPLRQLSNETNTIDNNMKQLRASMTQVGSMGGVFTQLGQSIKSAFSFMSASMIFYQLANQIRDIPAAVKDVETSFVELQKVSDVTANQFDAVINNAYKKGNELSATLTDYMGAMASINRGGYTSDEDINSLSSLSIIMKNVSENMKDTDANATALISTLKGFNGSATTDAEHYVNSFNNISNNMAVTFDQLVDGSQRISAIMSSYQNSFDETVAMITSGTEVFGGDVERVSTGIKSIAMNLGGITQIGEDANPEYIAKLSDELNSLAGIDITDANGELKSTFEILSELADVYPTLTANEKAYLGQLIGKKTQAPVLEAILQNWKSVEKAQELSISSLGSYEAEQSKYYESILGYTDRLSSAIQKLSVTSLDTGLVKQILQLTTNFVNLIDSAGGIAPVLASVVVSMTALKVISASQSLTFSGLTQGAKSLIASMFTVKTATDAATVSTLALSAAEKTLVVGAIVAGVMAIGAGIHYIATSSERAVQKVLDLSEELSKIKESSKTLEGLADEFEKLSKKGELNSEESKRFYEVQNQIKELQPEIGGYFDENGNFLIRQVSSAQELLDIQKEILEAKKEELKNAQEDVLDDNIKKYEKQKQLLEDIARYSELAEKGKKLSASEGMERSSLSNKITMNSGSVSDLDGTIKDIKSEIFEASNEIHDYLINSLTLDDAWDSLSESMKNGIRKTLSEMDAEEINDFSSKIKDGSLSISDFIGEMSRISTPVETVAVSLDTVSDASSETEETIKSLSERASESADSMDILKVALDELETIQDISGKTLDKLIKKYPELEDELTSVSTASDVLNKKIVEQNFDKATNNIASLTSVLEDLEAGNGLTAASFKKISSDFHELLKHMGDEVTLSEAIKEKMEEVRDTQTEAYRDMISNSGQYYDEENAKSEEYYNNKILGNVDTCNEIETMLKQHYSDLGVMYDIDLQNYTSIDQLKGKVTSDLINSLQKAWSTYFSNLGEKFADMSSKMNTLSLQRIGTTNPLNEQTNTLEDNLKSLKDDTFRQLEGVSNTVPKEIADITSKMNEIAIALNEYTFDPIDIKVGGDKSSSKSSSSEKYAEYIDSIYDSILSSLQEGTDKIDRQIAMSQSKIENLELFGNQEDITNANADLEKLYQDRIDIMKNSSSQMVSLRNKMAKELQATGYEEIKGLDLTNISQLGVDKIINKLEKQIDAANKANDSKLAASLTYKKNLIEDYTGNIINANSEINSMAKSIMDAQNELGNTVIDNINRVLDNTISKADSTLRQIDLEKMLLLTDGTSDAAKADAKKLVELNKRALSEIVTQRKATEDTINKLRAQGISDESDEIQTLLDKWADYESSRLTMIKEMAEARRKAAIDTAQDEVDGLQDALDDSKSLLDLTVNMLKKETEAKKDALKEQTDDRKDALEEQYDAEKKALDDKLDLIKKEANAQKDALKDEQDERNYNEEVSEKQKQIANVQSKITELSLDDSVSAQKKKKLLEEELDGYKKELEKLQYNRSIEIQTNAIDKELEAQEDKINEELEALKEQYDEEVDLIEKKYDKQLKEYEDYLSKEGNLRQDASDLIESKDRSFYKRLKEYATEYGSETKASFEDLWSSAYDGMEKYGNGQMDVIRNIESMTERIISLREEIEELNNTSYKDFIEDDRRTEDDDYKISNGASNSVSSGGSSSGNNSSSNNPGDTLSAKGKEQLNQQKYLHNQMVIAKETKNKQLEEWIKKERERWGLSPDTGAIVKQFHKGLEFGRIGDGLKPNELIIKATEDEWMFTGDQMRNLESNISNLLSNTNSNKSLSNGDINVSISFPNSTITKDSIPELEKMIDKKIPEVLNKTLFKRGIK